MRRLQSYFSFVVFGLLLSINIQALELVEGDNYFVTANGVNLRTSPGISNNVAGKLYVNDQIQLIDLQEIGKYRFVAVRLLNYQDSRLNSSDTFYFSAKYLSHKKIEKPFVLSPEERASHPYQIEALVSNIAPGAKWGHASFRVVGPEHDFIFDFGRYGEMWNFKSEGDPVMRIWENTMQEYMEYRAQYGSVTTRVVFASDEEKNYKLLNYYLQIIEEGGVYRNSERNFSAKGATNYLAKALGDFDSRDNNCSTITSDALEMAFGNLNIHSQTAFIEGRGSNLTWRYFDLGWISRSFMEGKLNSAIKRGREDGIMFWPEDLTAVLKAKASSWQEIILIEDYKEADGSKPAELVYKK